MAASLPSAVLVTRNMPPLQGGMERLNLRLVLALSSSYRVAVVGPTGCGEHLANTPVRVTEVRHRPLFWFVGCAVLKAVSLAWRHKPQLVIAGSGLTAPIVWFVATLMGAKTAVYLHGLDIVAEHQLYRSLWVPFIRKMQVVFVNSENTAHLARKAGVLPERVRILHPGTHLPGPDGQAGWAFREKYGFGQRPVLLSVGRLTRRKGIAEFVQHALPQLQKAFPDVLLLVIGGEARDALTNGKESQLGRISSAASVAGVEQAVRVLQHCDDETLSAAYRAADVHVFPVLEVVGDVEGFGMVAVEAAGHGLPTVGFRSGGVPDAVVEGQTGHLVTSGDYSTLVAMICQWLSRRADASARQVCFDAAQRFSWRRFDRGAKLALGQG